MHSLQLINHEVNRTAAGARVRYYSHETNQDLDETHFLYYGGSVVAVV